MIFKHNTLDGFESDYMNWLHNNFTVNTGRAIIATTPNPQMVLVSTKAIQPTSFALNPTESFARLAKHRYTSFYRTSASLKALLLPNECDSEGNPKSGVVILYDDKPSLFLSKTRATLRTCKDEAYRRNHRLLTGKVNSDHSTFTLEQEAPSFPNKIVVQGYGNVSIRGDSDEMSVVLLDFTPVTLVYNTKALHKRFVKEKRKVGTDGQE